MEPKYLGVDGAAFAHSFGVEPFCIQHSLCDHPLFRIDRLVQLATTLPPNRVEWNAGRVGVTLDPSATPSNGLSPEETVRRIEECDSWLVLKHVQSDAAYRQLLDDCLEDLAPHLSPLSIEMFRPQGFIFVSSPGATTPLHVDPENNFLLQVGGTKTLSAFDRSDRSVASQRDLERFAAGGHRNLEAPANGLDGATSFELGPGDGLHVPLHAPHFVRNGPGVSVSFSVTFQTKASDRERAVLWMNDKVRRVGLRPRPMGSSRAVDGWKHTLFRGLRGVKGLLR